MEDILINGEAPQDGDVTEKKVIDKNITLGIDDINNDIKKILPKKYLNKKNLDENDKKVLAVILHACRTKCHSELGFYPIPNRTLRNIAKVGSNSLTAITNKLKMLGLIDFEQGETRKKGKASQATRYTILFDDKLVKKSTYFNDTEQEFNDSHVDYTKLYYETQSKINDTQSEVIDTEPEFDKVFNDTQSSGIDTSIDNQGVTEKESKKSGVVNVNINSNIDLDSNLNLNRNIDLDIDMDRDMDLDVNRDMDLDVNRDMDLDVNRDGKLDVSKNNKTIDNTVENSTLMKELIKNIIISINHNTRVNLENNTKLIESINSNFKELTSSILSLKNGKETDSSIELYKKEIEERDNIINKLQVEKSKLQEKNNKLQEDYSKLIEERANSNNVNENGKSDGEVKTPSIQDKILSYSLEMATKHPTKDKTWRQEQQEKALQEASKQTSNDNTNVTRAIDKYMEGERQETIKYLDYKITKPFISSIVHANSYENLLKIRKDFKNEFKKCYTIHQDALTKSDVDPLIYEFYEAYDKKLDELQQAVNNNEPSINGNGIVQSEENNTKDSEQKPSKDETVEATDVETSPKEDETDNTRFQHDDKTSTDSENCQEKEDSTAEPNSVESENVQVSETDTPNCEEKSQEELDKEFEKETSTMFLINDSKKTVQAKKVEEVQFQKTEKIVLSSEEQNQFQELVNNQSINAVIKKYTVERNFEEILTEIRKAVTRGKYQEIVVQAYIDYTWNTYTFDCTVQDAMKPIEITNDDTVTTTVSTPKGDSFEEFIKDKVDNIRKNAEENGSELPFGKNPKSRYQDDYESNCYQSEEEKAAMSSSSSYDESQDEMF